ncbi:MAG: thermonuclease family protein [archaeon]
MGKKEIYFLILLVLILFAINYNFLDGKVTGFLTQGDFKSVHVERVIDGDTIVTENETIRLLGINSPERGEEFYDEAREFLEKEILNKTVRVEFVGEREDKYYRTLAYIHFNGKNINVKMVENGFANYYFYSGKDKYSNDLENAWRTCLDNNVNLCEKSEDICAQCISIDSGSVKNSCAFDCNVSGWEIKGEGRKKFSFEGELESGKSKEFSLDLSDSGGSLFLKDKEGKLVLWESY